MDNLLSITIAVMLLPLAGAIVAGLFGKLIGRTATHSVTIALMGIVFLLSIYLCNQIILKGHPAIDATLYHWVASGPFQWDVAILLDRLSAVMLLVVSFVSLVVHIYSVAYMHDDPGYERFFSYVSLFTFAMITLVLANNFLLLFFGWEGVGLVSYLLIGFWFQKDAATAGGLKAFIANRVGDVGFILAMAVILMVFHSFHYSDVFAAVPAMSNQTMLFGGHVCSVITLICILLLIGAMGKSAQLPLHVWLPESMEGPTPISALIHAATMVTAGIYMIARMSPLFEYSEVALSLILVIGATTCLLMGLVAVVQHDIKRVIAYSTLSQLGYMMVALGASAYDAAIFHLITHAFFKALLFLSAGSVIIALHHEQDMRRMGGLARSMPITYLTFAIGALALAAIPPFSGFYSKDMIIEAVHLSTTSGAHYAYLCVLAGAFLTPLYIFRAFFLIFHGKKKIHGPIYENGWTTLIPLIALAIPSVMIGGVLIYPMLFSTPHLLGDSIFVLPAHQWLLSASASYHGALSMAMTAKASTPFWLALIAIAISWIVNVQHASIGDHLKSVFHRTYAVLVAGFGFDRFNECVWVRGARALGAFFYQVADLKMIDGFFVNGSGRLIRFISNTGRLLQTGFIYHYALVMVIALLFFVGRFLLGF